jgi:hypothetical protein
MKRIFFFFAAAIMAGSMMAQTAVHNHTVTLNDGDTWEFPMTNPYEDAEIEISKNYAHQIESSALFRAMGGEEFLYGEVQGLMHSTAAGEFDNFHFKQGYLGHKLIQNKRFRDFLADRFCAILKDMCRLYPASTKKTLLGMIDKVLGVTDHVEQHTYKIVKYTHQNRDGSTWVEEALQKDGKIYRDNITGQDAEVVYGLEGFIARRMLYDNISLSEMRAYLQAARKAVADEDVSQNKEYMACYTINSDLKVFIATEKYMCRFRNGKQIDEISSITYLKDATGTYYKIIGQYTWRQHAGRGQQIATSTLYDNEGNKIYEDIVTKQ